MPISLPFDELNILKQRLLEAQKSPDTSEKRAVVDKLLDDVEEMLVMDYFYGVLDVSKGIGRSLDPDVMEARAVINERFDGKDYRDRLREYMQSGTAYDIERVIDTDAHRVYNAAVYTSAKRAGATKKTWHCLMLPTSRDTHIYMDGLTVGIDDEFYNYKGESTLYPGQWGIAEEDINCYCYITIG